MRAATHESPFVNTPTPLRHHRMVIAGESGLPSRGCQEQRPDDHSLANRAVHMSSFRWCANSVGPAFVRPAKLSGNRNSGNANTLARDGEIEACRLVGATRFQQRSTEVNRDPNVPTTQVRSDNGGHHRARPLWFPFVNASCRAPVDGMVIGGFPESTTDCPSMSERNQQSKRPVESEASIASASAFSFDHPTLSQSLHRIRSLSKQTTTAHRICDGRSGAKQERVVGRTIFQVASVRMMQ